MRRLVITFSAVVLVLSIAPAGALARHHHRRHHSRPHHARIERFGSDGTSALGGSNAGTVRSFHNGVLTIMRGNGSTVSGAVTGATELECTAPERDQAAHETSEDGSGDRSGDGDNSRSGDNSGSDGNRAQSSRDQRSGDDERDGADQNENQPEDQNENEPGEANENEDGQDCSTMNLTPGAMVREAELRISGASAVWKKVELTS